MEIIEEVIPKLFKRRSPKNMEDGVQYWKKVKGHKIYYYKNFDYMSVFRELGVRKGYAEFELGVRRDDLVAFRAKQKELFNKGDFASAMAAGDYLDMMLARFVSERITLEIGGWGILVNNEPWQEPRKKDMELKYKLLAEKEVRAFFLNNALNYLSTLSKDLNISDIEESLKNPMRKKREALFLTLIQTNIFDGLWKNLMPNPFGSLGKLA